MCSEVDRGCITRFCSARLLAFEYLGPQKQTNKAKLKLWCLSLALLEMLDQKHSLMSNLPAVMLLFEMDLFSVLSLFAVS